MEPTDEREWIVPGTPGFHDALAELLMHASHWADEDSSGKMSEAFRELLGLVGQYWGQLATLVTTGRLPDLSGARPAALFDLESDPYEDDDVAERQPEVVARIRARLDRLKGSFAPTCNWFITDTNLRHELVAWTDAATAERREAKYQAPFVGDEEWRNGKYVLALFNVKPARIWGGWAVVVLEIILGAALLRAVVRRMFTEAHKGKSDEKKY